MVYITNYLNIFVLKYYTDRNGVQMACIRFDGTEWDDRL